MLRPLCWDDCPVDGNGGRGAEHWDDERDREWVVMSDRQSVDMCESACDSSCDHGRDSQSAGSAGFAKAQAKC